MTVAGVLLAAGGSRRMGRSKALLAYRGTTLLRHAAEVLCATQCLPRFVIVGPDAEKSSAQVKDLDVTVVVNPDHARGLSTSIRATLRAMASHASGAGPAAEAVEAILISLVDQPLVTHEHLTAILEAGRETGLAATSFANTFGPPAFLYRSFFPALNELQGDEGAKVILSANRESLRLVEFAGAAFDVDDPADYERLLSGAKA